MTASKPDFVAGVHAARFPVHADADRKSYVSFQLLNEAGFADEVFYRDLALTGTEHIMKAIVEAYMDRRKLEVWLAPISEGKNRVAKVKVGDRLT